MYNSPNNFSSSKYPDLSDYKTKYNPADPSNLRQAFPLKEIYPEIKNQYSEPYTLEKPKNHYPNSNPNQNEGNAALKGVKVIFFTIRKNFIIIHLKNPINSLRNHTTQKKIKAMETMIYQNQFSKPRKSQQISEKIKQIITNPFIKMTLQKQKNLPNRDFQLLKILKIKRIILQNHFIEILISLRKQMLWRYQGL